MRTYSTSANLRTHGAGLARRAQTAWLTILLLMVVPATAQERTRAYPEVTYGGMPRYPSIARMGGLQGTIRLSVETAGESVANVKVISDGGEHLLAQAAEANIRTWKFEKHDHDSFSVTYRYVLKSGGARGSSAELVLRLPLYVEVIARPWPHGEPHRKTELGPAVK